MENVISKANLLWGGCAALLASVFGEFWFLFLAFLLLNIADYGTGFAKARMSNTENSNQGLKGIIKKVGYWLVIAIAFFIATACEKMGTTIGINLSFLVYVGWFTLATFIINEIRSILENLVEMGVEVPAFLISGLEVAAKKITEKEDGK